MGLKLSTLRPTIPEPPKLNSSPSQTMRTRKTRLLLLSDTHNALPSESSNRSAKSSSTTTTTTTTTATSLYQSPLPRADILLHAGDITLLGLYEEYEKILTFLSTVEAELKLVIAGNHDISLDERWYTRGGGDWLHEGRVPKEERDGLVSRVRQLWCSEEVRNAGIVYLDEGFREFKLKGGIKFTVYASPWQPEHGGWAFGYGLDEDRYNNPESVDDKEEGKMQEQGEEDDDDDDEKRPLNPVPDFPQVDILLTHGPPKGRLDRTWRGLPVGCPHLGRAVERARPRLHCFGHIHESWGAERVRWRRKGDGEGVKGIEDVFRYEPDRHRMMVDRAAYLDVSGESERPLVFGEETLFVNACINDVRYKAVQAPWLIDLDLPVVDGLDDRI